MRQSEKKKNRRETLFYDEKLKLSVGVPLVLTSSHSVGHVKLNAPIVALTEGAADAAILPMTRIRVLAPLKIPAPLKITAVCVSVAVWKKTVVEV